MTTGEWDPHGVTPVPAGADEPRTEEDLHAADAHRVGGGHEHEHMVAGHAHEDDHSTDHAETRVGPVDWGAWLVGAIGVGAGSVIAIVLAVAIQHG